MAAWVTRQPDGFRLNFFVDEVGQFIGSSSQLMLNLQTIAESLATKCRGRAWVFVTSQEDMEKVGGDRTKSQANDFSKIQARFKSRLKLTSQDVEEVIRKRLLDKRESARAEVAAIFAAEHANFKTLFDFVEGRHYRNYRDETHFIGTYPFVPYQFPLFQSAIEGISDHNIFEGRNSSVGERSMLGVVQEVARSLASKPLGELASFDQMFEGVRASLKSTNQRAINDAERSPSLPPLAVRLLKALFLVKYVDTFKATPRNLTVLVYDRFGSDLGQLGKDVNEALASLEAQTYIQRNGDVYDYLTNEEQKIEQEIKNVDIDSPEVSKKLADLLTSTIVKSTKAIYGKTGQNFPIGFKIDGQAVSKQHELSLHFISPETEFSLEQIKAHSAGLDELRVVFGPESERILADLRLLLKTEKYIKRAQGSSRTTIEQTILQARATQNAEREKEIIERLRTAVGHSTLIHNASVLDASSHDAVGRINEGFQKVIAGTYTNLALLGGKSFSEQELSGLVNPPEGALFTETANILAVPGDDVLAHLEMSTKRHVQVTMKHLIERYTTKPYGWDHWSVAAVVGYLAGSSKIELQLNGKVLVRTEIASALRNTQSYPNIVVALERLFDQKVVTAFRKFLIEFTDDGAITKDPRELARVGKDRLDSKLAELETLRADFEYPFIGELDEPIRMLEDLCSKNSDWFVTQFAGADDLLDAKDNVIDPIKAFLHGTQRRIYDEAAAFIRSNPSNIDYLPASAADEVVVALNDPHIFRGSKVSQLGDKVKTLEEKLEEVLKGSRASATKDIKARWDHVPNTRAYSNATEGARSSVTRTAQHVLERVQQETQIPAIEKLATQFADSVYPKILDELEAGANVPGPGPTPPQIKQTVSIKTLPLPGTGNVLESEADVDGYLDQLRATLLTAIHDNKRITL